MRGRPGTHKKMKSGGKPSQARRRPRAIGERSASDLSRAKADLVERIRNLIAARSLNQTEAAALLGLDQPKVSALIRGHVEGFSVDRLFRLLNALGQQVKIFVGPNTRKAKSRAVVVV
jgi:predicted XRE-type DNA-binding protein